MNPLDEERPSHDSIQEVRGTLVVRSTPRRSHDCLGEQVVLRLTGEEVGQVLSSERCGQCPADGCDGVPFFRPGDLVVLPAGWQSRPESPLRTEELRRLAGFGRR